MKWAKNAGAVKSRIAIEMNTELVSFQYVTGFSEG
jgi:hypothetical protein